MIIWETSLHGDSGGGPSAEQREAARSLIERAYAAADARGWDAFEQAPSLSAYRQLLDEASGDAERWKERCRAALRATGNGHVLESLYLVLQGTELSEQVTQCSTGTESQQLITTRSKP